MEDLKKEEELKQEEYKKEDNRLYAAKQKISNIEKPEDVWEEISNNKEMLEWAIKPTKDVSGTRDIVNALTTCDFIITNYENVDPNIYQELINTIYSKEQIARISVNEFSFNPTFLLKTLYNTNLLLTEEQKEFVVDEAMNQMGTTRYKNRLSDYTEPKVGNIYMAGIYNLINDSKQHGTGPYDIRYWILKNNSWTKEEKKELISDFWLNDKDYKETFEKWENDAYGSRDNKEIEFCEQVKELRPLKKAKVKVKKSNL